MIELNVSDFDFEEEDEVSVFPDLWQNKEVYTIVNIEFADGSKLDENTIVKFLPLINKELNWINDNKKLFDKALAEGNITELAGVWTAGLEKQTENGSECLVRGKDIIPLPITLDNVLEALQFNGIGIEIEENGDLIDIELAVYFEAHPDYFENHTLEMVVNNNHEVTFFGLVV